MSGRVRVKGPDDSRWTVRRRWLPWRPALLLKALWRSIPDDSPSEPVHPKPGASTPAEKPAGCAVSLLVQPVAGLIELGRFVLLVLVLVVSGAELAVQLLVMPLVLLARALGVLRWPVQIDRDKRHYRTEYAAGLDAAAVLRDELAGQIQNGTFTCNKP